MKPGTLNAERLLALYERVADAPDAIARLRRFVLDLAVRGKLMEQDPKDESASELLKNLKNERLRLEKQKAIRQLKLAYGPIGLETDRTLPANWTITTIGETCDLQTGATPDRARAEYFEGDIPWLVSGDINRGEIFECDGRISEAGLAHSNCKILPENCVLIALNGQGKTRGTVALLRMRAACNQSLVAIIPLLPSELTPEFVHLSLKARYLAIRDLTGKDERRGLNMRLIACFEIAIPPLAEQRRIVAKVEELMALLDRLEAARTTAEANRERLTAASLARLTAPDTTPDAFPAHARFALDAFPALTTRPDQIKALRQTILNLAVRGKLVEQDPNDEPASELLKRITAEKASLVKARVIKKEKPLPTLPEEEVALNPPTGWTWCRLGSLVLSSDAGWSPRTESHSREGDAWGVLKVSAVSWDYFDPNANKQLLPGTEPRLQAKVSKGDFLISRANTAALVARAVLIHDEPQNLMMSDKIVRLRLATELDHSFIWLVNNNAEFARAYYAANATGVSPSMKNVSRAVILNLPIPLPPLAEQGRIVAKVDALMALCDRLEAALTTANTTKQRLLEALLHETLTPAATARELEAAAV